VTSPFSEQYNMLVDIINVASVYAALIKISTIATLATGETNDL